MDDLKVFGFVVPETVVSLATKGLTEASKSRHDSVVPSIRQSPQQTYLNAFICIGRAEREPIVLVLRKRVAKRKSKLETEEEGRGQGCARDKDGS